MVITTDDFVKIALTLAICFSIIGISWQIIRVMGGLVDSVKESNLILKLAHDFVEKFMEDYDYIIEQVKYILDGFSGLSKSIITPLSKLSGIFKIFNHGGKGNSKKKSQANDEEVSE